MEKRPPTASVAILHLLEDFFDHKLAAISLDDLDVIPARSVRDENVLAKVRIGLLLQFFGIDAVFDATVPVSIFINLHFDDGLQVLAAQNTFHLVLQGFPGWRLASDNYAVETILQFLMQFREPL
jgi:hypothetical protein